LLGACTTKAPFRHIDGTLYQQIDGIAMGSPLGVAFANFYMCHIENSVLSNTEAKPSTYCRYVDDCYVVVRSPDQLEKLRQELEANSVLRFTTEISINNKLNFLDVQIDTTTGHYSTAVYKKPTCADTYLNAESECPERYKIGTVKALIHRTYKITSSWHLFNNNIQQLKQALVNNGYSNSMFDQILMKYLNDINDSNVNTVNGATTHTLMYRNQYSTAYKTDERVIRSIIKNNINCINPDDKLKLIIYYKSHKTSNLIMKNNLCRNQDKLKSTNVIYQYNCKIGECELQESANYIGMTTTTLSRRLTMHLASGGPKIHSEVNHKQKLTRAQLVDNTTIIRSCNDYTRLQIMEAIIIKQQAPTINNQCTGIGRTLKLLGSTLPSS
jgi:hypothetical protein